MRLFVACLLLLGATAVVAQETRIGYIDTRRIEKESVPFVRALEAMKKEFAPREQQILDMQKQIVAHRSARKKDGLESVDWRKFYESVKEFLEDE